MYIYMCRYTEIKYIEIEMYACTYPIPFMKINASNGYVTATTI